MLKHGRSTREYTKEVALILSSIQPKMHGLGSDGDTLVDSTGGPSATRLRPRTVRAVQEVLQQLSEQEEQIVRMRYGIGTRMHSVHEISQRLGVIPRHIERIELRAFQKLRDTSVVSERLEKATTPPAPFQSGKRPPVLPAEPLPFRDDSNCEANPWDEV